MHWTIVLLTIAGFVGGFIGFFIGFMVEDGWVLSLISGITAVICFMVIMNMEENDG